MLKIMPETAVIAKIIKIAKKIANEIKKPDGAGNGLKLIRGKGGFGLMGVIAGLLIISIMAAAAIPTLAGYYKLEQAKAAINEENSLINAENQYQMASYSNYAEQGSAQSNNDYFGTLSEMTRGLNILPSDKQQYFLPQGISLSLASYGGNVNCIQKNIGGNVITECLGDEGSGQYEILTYGLNNPELSAYVPMFENGIKGGISSYASNTGILTTQVSVPFGFSAYPKINNGGSGNSGNTAAGAGSNSNSNNGGGNRGSGGGSQLDEYLWSQVPPLGTPGYSAAMAQARAASQELCGDSGVIC